MIPAKTLRSNNAEIAAEIKYVLRLLSEARHADPSNAVKIEQLKVQGLCAWCGGESLFLDENGVVTCSAECARPGFTHEILQNEKLHRVVQAVVRELDDGQEGR